MSGGLPETNYHPGGEADAISVSAALIRCSWSPAGPSSTAVLALGEVGGHGGWAAPALSSILAALTAPAVRDLC